MHEKRSRFELSHKEYKRLCQFEVFPREHFRCRICGNRRPLHAHHIVYRSHHGDDATWNLLSVCTACHDAIHLYYVLILPKNGDLEGIVNADEGVKILIVNRDWIVGTPPKRKQR